MDTDQCGVLHPNEKVAHWINNGIGPTSRTTDAQQHARQAQNYKDLIGELFKSNESHSRGSAVSFDKQGRSDQIRSK
ncbi:hypothetical protein N7513_011815 [Penicillium frequentans]|uniref:Uncharacterized protein n=1 Tax=Penicillium frequentans TaxID=3151616 RepID=A0AAD6D0K3_9EURO|nr:hypothetical protein N7513_011815 [Penicillium glabrum]KAJ5546707.1 hypothetical protein N7494_004292 [Penicillium glabrum]